MLHSQMLPTPLKLMKLQLHRQAECTVSRAGDQYVRIKYAPVSSAAPAPPPAPVRGGTKRNKSAAKGFAAVARSARSSPAGRTSARKNDSLVITLAASLSASASAALRLFTRSR